MWTVGGYGASLGLRFTSNVILTHIFPPQVMGLMALVNTFLNGITLFSDVGIRPSIIHNKRGDDPDFLNTAWTIQAIRGAGLWIASIVLAWPYGVWLYGEPLLAMMLPVAGFGSLVMGLFSSNLASQNRKLNLGRITLIEVATQAVTLVILVGLSIAMRSIWALVMGSVISAIVKLVLSHKALPGIKNRFRWDPSAVTSLLSFGRWIFINTMLTFLVSQSDKLVLGKLVPLAVLGVYNTASQIVMLPTNLFGTLSNQVAFPLYTGTILRGEKLGPTFRNIRWLAMLASGAVLATMIAAGPALVRIIWPAEYWEAGWILQVLAVGAVFGTIETLNSHALLALAQQRWNVVSRIAMIGGMAVTISVGYWQYDFVGAVVGFAAAELFRYVVSGYAITKNGISAWGQDLKLMLMLGGSVALSYGAVELVHRSVENKYLDVVIAGLIVNVIFAVPAYPVAKRFLAQRRKVK